MPRTLARLLPLDRSPRLVVGREPFEGGADVGEEGSGLVAALEVVPGQVRAEGVVGPADLAEGPAHGLLADGIEVVDRAPHVGVGPVADVDHHVDGEAGRGSGVVVREFGKGFMEGLSGEGLEVPESAVDVEGDGGYLGEVGHCWFEFLVLYITGGDVQVKDGSYSLSSGMRLKPLSRV